MGPSCANTQRLCVSSADVWRSRVGNRTSTRVGTVTTRVLPQSKCGLGSSCLPLQFSSCICGLGGRRWHRNRDVMRVRRRTPIRKKHSRAKTNGKVPTSQVGLYSRHCTSVPCGDGVTVALGGIFAGQWMSRYPDLLPGCRMCLGPRQVRSRSQGWAVRGLFQGGL